MSAITIDNIDKSFKENGWTEEKVGEDATVFMKPVSESVIQNMPDVHVNQRSGLGNMIDLLGAAIRLMAK